MAEREQPIIDPTEAYPLSQRAAIRAQSKLEEINLTVKVPMRVQFIPHDGYAKMPPRTRVSHRPTTQIQELVAVAYGLHPDRMMSRDRRPIVTWPRMIAMYLTREITGRSMPSIAQAFCKKDHTTILHALRTVKRRMEESPRVRDEVEALRKALVG